MELQNRKENDHVTDLLSAFLDGELPAGPAEAVRRHLDRCPACRKEFEALTSVDHLIKGLREVRPSADFSRDFWKKVEKAESRRGPVAGFFETFFNSWRPALGAASALVILAAGSMFLYRAGSEKAEPAPVVAENLTFYGDYELLENLELFENWEAITSLEEI